MGLQKSHQGGMISLSGPWTNKDIPKVSVLCFQYKRITKYINLKVRIGIFYFNSILLIDFILTNILYWKLFNAVSIVNDIMFL